MNANEPSPTPIACALGASAYQERLTWIAELNRTALKGAQREGARLTLTYDPLAKERVREMIRREQECCAFLQFELSEEGNGLTLAITAPEDARDLLDALFDPFEAGSNPSGTSCGCATVRK